MGIIPQELRIGNWYNFRNPMSGDAEPSRFDIWSEGLAFETYGEPIPLTPDILQNAGFTKHKNSNEYWTFWWLANGWHIAESHHNEPSAGTEVGKFYWGDEYKEVKSLHQLQTLYFALTGKELTYKPDKK